jgi:hypothetical protein
MAHVLGELEKLSNGMRPFLHWLSGSDPYRALSNRGRKSHYDSARLAHHRCSQHNKNERCTWDPLPKPWTE